MTCLTTGEVFKSDCLGYFENLYKNSAYYLTETILESHSAEIDILIYLSRLDGRFTAKEKDLIFEYLNELSGNQMDEEHRVFIDREFKFLDASQTKANRAIKNLKDKEGFSAPVLIEKIENLQNLVKKKNPVAEAGAKMMIDKLSKFSSAEP